MQIKLQGRWQTAKSVTQPHRVPKLDARGRKDMHSTHKCILEHQYHISCGRTSK